MLLTDRPSRHVPWLILSGPDFLAMTGQGAGKCGVGAAEFRVVVTDKQIVEPDAYPPDALSGKDTFSNASAGGTAFNSPADQVAYFESIRVKAPERTDYGWLGQTPAGTDNFMGKGPGSGSAGYVDSGPHPEMPNRGKAPAEWTAAQLAGTGNGDASGSDGKVNGGNATVWTSGDPVNTALANPSPTVPSWSDAPPTVDPSGSPVIEPTVPPAGSPTGAPGAVNLVQSDGSPSGNPGGVSEGIQAAASGVASISGGNCVAGNWRCNGNVVEVCAAGNDSTIGEFSHSWLDPRLKRFTMADYVKRGSVERLVRTDVPRGSQEIRDVYECPDFIHASNTFDT